MIYINNYINNKTMENKRFTLTIKLKSDQDYNQKTLNDSQYSHINLELRNNIKLLLKDESDLNENLIDLLDIELCNYVYDECTYMQIDNKNIYEYNNLYRYKGISLVNNLTKTKNPYLYEQVNNGSISLNKLLKLTPQELYPSNWDFYKNVVNKKVQQLNTELQFNSEFYTCGMCHNNKTYTYQKQLRSQDEGATTIVICCTKGCKNKWHA